MLRRNRAPDSIDAHPDLLWHIDEPANGARVREGWILVRGWIAVPADAECSEPSLCLGNLSITPPPESRPDLERLFPQRRVAGFCGVVRVPEAGSDGQWALGVAVRGQEHRLALPFSITAGTDVSEVTFPFDWYLDSPRAHPEPAWHSQVIRGWMLVPPEARLEEVFVDCGTRVALAREERPDIETLHQDHQVVGFRQLVSITPSTEDEQWSIGVKLDGREYRVSIPVSVPTEARDEFFVRKTSKLALIEPILRCPRPLEGSRLRACGGKLERVDAGWMLCLDCSQQYPITEHSFDFLSRELREISGIRETENISSLPYGDGELPELIAEYSDGLILDCGSGLRDVYYENVVNFEVVDYVTTDVLGVGEYLPFADGSFDALISIAVLEHVRNPFDCASEMARVVRPGGRIFVMVPFLQPYHGYPHHYYNMTRSGLENLFSEHFAIERSGLPPGGQPIWTLPWLLNLYVTGLPSEAAEHFKQLTVRDLLAEGSTFLEEDFVCELDPRIAESLAHVTYLVATKR